MPVQISYLAPWEFLNTGQCQNEELEKGTNINPEITGTCMGAEDLEIDFIWINNV